MCLSPWDVFKLLQYISSNKCVILKLAHCDMGLDFTVLTQHAYFHQNTLPHNHLTTMIL